MSHVIKHSVVISTDVLVNGVIEGASTMSNEHEPLMNATFPINIYLYCLHVLWPLKNEYNCQIPLKTKQTNKKTPDQLNKDPKVEHNLLLDSGSDSVHSDF